MSTQTEAMKLALEALEGLEALLLSMGLTHLIVYGDAEKAITAMREALAEQPAQQEPVAPKCGAIIEVFGHDWRLDYLSLPVGKHKLYTQQYTYTAPQPQPSKPLTDEEIRNIWSNGDCFEEIAFARAIEAAHGIKEKNT